MFRPLEIRAYSEDAIDREGDNSGRIDLEVAPPGLVAAPIQVRLPCLGSDPGLNIADSMVQRSEEKEAEIDVFPATQRHTAIHP